MKHILFISSWFPTKDNPFSGDFVQRHAKAVATLNQVTVIHTTGVKNKNEVETVVQNSDSNYLEIIAYFKKSWFKPLNAIRKFNAYRRLYKQINKPDIIHANIIYTNLIWVLYIHYKQKVPFVITEHWTGYHYPKRIGTWRKILAKKIAKQASFILPVSMDLKFAMQKCGIEGNFKVVPNVVNTNRFTPQNTISSTTRFLHLSMLNDEHKNISGMLIAAHLLKQKGFHFSFKIGGNGDTAFIENKIKTLDLTDCVQIFPEIPHNEVPNLFNHADCFILFSNKENQPCVIIEAFSCGTPVIASDVGGIKEYFPNDFGHIVSPKNITELTKAMEEVIQKKEYAKSEVMHKYAVENFSIESIAKQFDIIYTEILALENE